MTYRNRILWIGAGMGDVLYQGPWPDAFMHLLANPIDPLHIGHLKMIDLIDRPKIFFADNFAQEHGMIQESAKGDFFSEQGEWDIIILDFIEAWQLGRQYWPSLRETPYSLILEAWEEKLLQLGPHQVWVRHDAAPSSTIIPMLQPDYRLVVDVQTTYSTGKRSLKEMLINPAYWNLPAARQFDYLHVWQID